MKLYRRGVLEGLFLPNSTALEQWSVLEREQLQREVAAGLCRSTGWLERRREYQLALSYARRQVLLEPWQERANSR